MEHFEGEHLQDPNEVRRGRIGRHLKQGRGIEAELAAFATLTEEKRRIVDERLAVIDGLPTGEARSRADVERAAELLGGGVRNLYRLIDRMKQVGPIGGLAPGFRATVRDAPVRTGLGEPIEGWIAEKLRRKPDATVSEIADHLSERFEKFKVNSADQAVGGVRVRLPPSSTLHRRVHAIRSSEKSSKRLLRRSFGGRMVLDQIALNVTARTVLGNRNAVATFIVDRTTKLIVGVGVTFGDGIGMGLGTALSDAIRRRLDGIVRSGIAIDEGLTRLEWVVPAGLEDVADAVLEGAALLDPAPEIVIRSTGNRRHGSELVRLLGDRLGAFGFRVRATGSADGGEHGFGSIVDGAVPMTDARLDPEDVLRSLRVAADEANASKIASIAKSDEPFALRAAKAAELAVALRTLFDPVMRRIEERFVRHEDYEHPPHGYF